MMGKLDEYPCVEEWLAMVEDRNLIVVSQKQIERSSMLVAIDCK